MTSNDAQQQIMNGIVKCQDWTSPFCIEKSVQLSVSGTVLTIALLQLTLHICRQQQRCSIKSKYIIMTTMVLSLLSDCMHCMYHEIVQFWLFETLFFNIYFLTIVYYTFLKLLEKYRGKKWGCSITTLRVTYAFLVIFYVGVLIGSTVLPDKRCEQIWYLTVRSMGLFLAIMLIVFGLLNHKEQKKRLLDFPALKSYSNPFPALWMWIGTNTAAQLANVIQSLVFALDASLDCKFSQNVTVNFILTFVMLCLTYYLAIIPTLWVFWVPICEPERSVHPSEDYYEVHASGIEIVPKSSCNASDGDHSLIQK